MCSLRGMALLASLMAVGLNSLPAAEPKTAEQQVREALEQPTEFMFFDTPLSEIAEYVAAKHDIRVLLDERALDDAGLAPDEPMTLRLRGVKLKNALQLLLRDHDLHWIIDNEVLQITTIDEACQRLETKIYDVADLIAPETAHDDRFTVSVQDDYDSLIEAITRNIAPTTWDEVGGPGSISGIYKALFISQTAAVHESIEELLTGLRRMRQERNKSLAVARAEEEPRPLDPQRLIVRVYRLPVPMRNYPAAIRLNPSPEAAEPANTSAGQNSLGQVASCPNCLTSSTSVPDDRYLPELVATVPQLIRPETWRQNGGEGVISTLPANADGKGVLLVRQTAEVHGELHRFLSSLPAATRDRASGFEGGGFF